MMGSEREIITVAKGSRQASSYLVFPVTSVATKESDPTAQHAAALLLLYSKTLDFLDSNCYYKLVFDSCQVRTTAGNNGYTAVCKCLEYIRNTL